jgi:hypothetical protein
MPHKYYTKILKTISFIHSGLQIHYLSVVLQRLPKRRNTIQSGFPLEINVIYTNYKHC